jgi:SNF2 family DNA or RNA helicase
MTRWVNRARWVNLMPKLTSHCPICSKELREPKVIQIGPSKLISYKCGHVFARDLTRVDKSTLDFTSVDGSGKKARAYQEDGVVSIIESDFNNIIGHQMRIGKTPEALLALKNAYAERTPCLILVRAANLWQWIREYRTWCDTLPNGIFPIIGTTAWIPNGFSAYIMSMDTFGANSKCECGHRFHELQCKGNGKTCSCRVYQSDGCGLRDKLKKIPFKLIIADEAHSFKNSDSNRSQALVDFVKFYNIPPEPIKLSLAGYSERNQDKPLKPKKPCGLLLLTGTVIKNRADEFFVPLNLVAPEIFPSETSFQRSWLRQDSKGKYSQIKSYLLEDFKRTIAPYYRRLEKEDVFKDLPALNRIFTVIEPEKDSYAKIYNSVLDKLETKLGDKANPTYWDLAEDMMELRRICGMMKLSWLVDYLEISLMDSENQKFAIGLHHQTVRDVLYHKLGGSQNCWIFSGAETLDRKNYIETHYETMPQRIGILNMLAGGVGCDFHNIDSVLILERQWNSADEEQFEFRFYNPDLNIKSRSTNIEYILAKGTLDEWWHDMVEEKRRIFGETVGNHWNLQTDNASFKSLVERTVAGRI